MAELRPRDSKCEFCDLHDSVKDILIVRLKDLCFAEHLLRKLDLTLSKPIKTGYAAKETKMQAKELVTSQTPEMDISFIKC